MITARHDHDDDQDHDENHDYVMITIIYSYLQVIQDQLYSRLMILKN